MSIKGKEPLPDDRDSIKYRMVVSYVGTRYSGWQIQQSRWTVQGKLRNALSRLAGRKVTVVGASRTDAGVHARGQVAHFYFPEKETIADLRRALNALLPWDIRVRRIERAHARFHARRDALEKLYEYRLFSGPVFPPFLHNLALHSKKPLRVEAMKEAASLLVGSHDFTGYAAASTTVQNRVRRIERSEIVVRGARVRYRVAADGFLHHMVRNIMGTLLQVGREERAPEEILKPIRARDRTLAGPTAPPQGLYLMKIWYPEAPGGLEDV